MNKRSGILWMILLGAILIAVAMVGQGTSKDVEIPISDFVHRVENGEIVKVTIVGDRIRGETAHGGLNTYATEKEELIKALHDKRVPYEEKQPAEYGSWLMLLLKLAIPLVIIVVIARGLKNMGPGGSATRMQTGHKSKMQTNEKTTFADVAGVDEAVEECRDLVTFLKEPKKFATLGGKSPRGILLIGPPGNGKTLLARAIAGEAGVPFFHGSASEFVEMFVGVGAARVRDLFGAARKHAPCIVFIDEIDAVGKKRAGLSGMGGHQEQEQTLNQILVEMDGFAPNDAIIVIAATNRPETLDPALLRTGRFDRKVVVPPPDVRGREAILKVHARNKVVAPDVNYSDIARGTPGLVGSDLEQIMNEAALDAAKLGKKAIEAVDVERAKEKIFMGPERKSAVLSERIKEIVAWHEAGHAIVGWFTPDADPPHRVTIIPRGMALGLTWMLPSEDALLKTRKQLLAGIKVSLGGRAAEKLLLGDDYTTGAGNDLDQATETVRRMVEDYGMGEGLGPGTYGKKDRGFIFDHSQKDFSEHTASRIDAEKRRILEDCEKEVTALVKEKRPLIESLVSALRSEETIGLDRLVALLGPRASVM